MGLLLHYEGDACVVLLASKRGWLQERKVKEDYGTLVEDGYCVCLPHSRGCKL